MAHYTQLDRNSLVKILENYQLDAVEKITALDGGQANSSSILYTRSGTYVLSVCDEKSFDELELLTRTLEHLHRNGIPTTRLVRTKDNRPFIEYDKKPVYVKEFIEGSVPGSLTPAMVRQLGVALAELHAVPVPDYLSTRFPYGIESFDDLLHDKRSFPRWLSEKSHYLMQCINPELPTGLIHGDLFHDNTVFQGEQLAALLDFEEVCNYYLIFDLGMCAAGCCCLSGTLSVPLTVELVHGYQSVRPLTDLEKKLFKCHIEYSAISTAFWRYRQYNIRLPDIGMNDTHETMRDLADQIGALDNDSFMQEVFAEWTG